MAQSIEQFITSLRATIKDIEDNRVKDVQKIAADSLALVKRRVINKGKQADGSSFGTYSTKVVPFWFYIGKETNRSNQAAVDDLYNKFGFFASYRDWRVVNNLQVRFKNFSFTNRMWNSLRPVVEEQKPGRAVITIKARSQKEEDKVKFANAKHGDILALSKDERDLVTELNNDRIIGYFEKHGLI